MPLSDSRPHGKKTATPHAKWSMVSPTGICGHVFDPHDPEKRFIVELLIDGVPTAIARAELHVAHLARDEPSYRDGDGCHGFVFNIDRAALGVTRQIEVRLANRGDVLAPPLLAPALEPEGGDANPAGAVRWLGGLRFNGWLGKGADATSRVRALHDGQIVAETMPAHWAHVGDGDTARARGFDLFLPIQFADGRARQVQILDDHERELSGSPCGFVAFEDGLARFVDQHAALEAQQPRTKLFDRRAPQSLPFSMLAHWRERFFGAPTPAPDRAALENPTPKIGVALIGERDVEASVASLEAQRGCEWVAAVFEGGGESSFHNGSLRDFLDGEAKDCELVVFAPCGAVFEPTALAQLARALALFPGAPAAYGDFTLAQSHGGEWPVALPAFGYERMLEQGFAALLFALPTPAARAAVAGGAENLFRLFNFSQDARPAAGPRPPHPAAATPVHQPGFLARLPRLEVVAATQALALANRAHLAARGVQAKIEPGVGALFACVRVMRRAPRGKVSILIPTRDRVDLLQPCLNSLFATVDLARHEAIVLDNDSSDPASLAFFAQIVQRGVRVIRVGGPFNFAKIINKGASIAVGDYLLLLNNDVEALTPGWLDEMLGRMAEPDVGAVGATLLWPDGAVQHGGVVLGPHLAAGHAFNERIDGDFGYADLLSATHEVSAVTAACLLTDRRLFLELGGFDGLHFPVNFNDVDYCLKLRAKGLRVIQATQAKLLHRESASRGLDRRADRKDRFRRELENLRAIWGEALIADPCYSPLLSLDEFPFSALSWPPRDLRARQDFSPPPRLVPPGF